MTKRNKFDIDEELEEQFNIQHLKRVLHYVKPYIGRILVVLGVIFIANIAALLNPLLIQIALDEAIPNGNTTLLYQLAVIFLVTIVMTGLSMRFRILAITKLGQNILEDMRLDLFTHLQKLPFTYYDSRPHGKILIRVVNYINTLSDLLSNGLINLISDLMSLIVALAFMIYLDASFTLYSFAFMPFLLIIVFKIKNAQRKAYQNLSNKQSNLNAYIHESISGIKVSQAFAREDMNHEIFEEVSDEYQSSWLKAVKIQFLLWPSVQNISVLSTCLIYFIGVRNTGGVSLGVLVAFVGYLSNFWNPIINLGNFYNSLITASAYLERIFEVLDEKPVIQDQPNAYPLPHIEGNISFKSVNFSYDSDKKILNQVSFDVKQGETIALVGPTGAGKSTIINLINRFYNIDSGQILIDTHNINEVTLKSLRSQVGVMLQDTFIFSGTIMDNIRYGRLDATDEEVIAAAKAVQAHDFIHQLKEGYQTEVTERGSNFSAGQRQLISFARTLLADPKILILDEATSSIDTQTEQKLQIALNRLLEGRTSFIIAHRLSTIRDASRIFYIDQGQIVEMGTHAELIKKENGRYYQLYHSQFNVLKTS